MKKAQNLLLNSLSFILGVNVGRRATLSLQECKGGRDLLSFGLSRKVGRELTLGWTLNQPTRPGSNGGGYRRQAVSVETLTGLNVHDMCGEWCIIAYG